MSIFRALFTDAKPNHFIFEKNIFHRSMNVQNCKHMNSLNLILILGANVNSLKRADWTPLMLACTKKGLEAHKCIQLLLKAHANLSIRNKDGWTAFHVACRSADLDIIHLLLEYSEKSTEAESNNGRNALHIAGN